MIFLLQILLLSIAGGVVGAGITMHYQRKRDGNRKPWDMYIAMRTILMSAVGKGYLTYPQSKELIAPYEKAAGLTVGAIERAI